MSMAHDFRSNLDRQPVATEQELDFPLPDRSCTCPDSSCTGS